MFWILTLFKSSSKFQYSTTILSFLGASNFEGFLHKTLNSTKFMLIEIETSSLLKPLKSEVDPATNAMLYLYKNHHFILNPELA